MRFRRRSPAAARTRAARALVAGVVLVALAQLPLGGATPARTPLFSVYKPTAAELAQFEQWVGRRVDVPKVHMRKDAGWSGWESPGWLSWYPDRTLAVNLAPFPNSEGGAVGGTAQAGAALRRAATGVFDHHYVAFARKLVAAGHEDAFLSFGHELNGDDWYPWSAVGHEADYVAMWRRVVPRMQAVPGARFRFVWNPTAMPADMTESQLAGVYPGDDVVDVIGINLYDVSYRIAAGDGADWQVRRWLDLRTRDHGLDWFAWFAARHGKPLAIPEWGLVTTRSNPNGGGDNAYFIERMYEWIRANNVLFEAYHSVDNGTNDHEIEDAGDYRLSGPVYRRLANTVRAAASPTTRPTAPRPSSTTAAPAPSAPTTAAPRTTTTIRRAPTTVPPAPTTTVPRPRTGGSSPPPPPKSAGCVARNLFSCAEQDFESGTARWHPRSAGGVVSSRAPYTGHRSLALIASNGGADVQPGRRVPVTGGALYALELRARAGTVGRPLHLEIHQRDGAGRWFSRQVGAGVARDVPSSWAFVRWVFRVPPGAASVRPVITLDGARSGEVHLIDYVVMRRLDM
jgi:hypothetical protein